jgi:hypothetical protein
MKKVILILFFIVLIGVVGLGIYNGIMKEKRINDFLNENIINLIIKEAKTETKIAFGKAKFLINKKENIWILALFVNGNLSEIALSGQQVIIWIKE